MSRGSGPAGLVRAQRLFWDLITAPEGVRPALESLQRAGGREARAVDEVFAGDGRLSAIDRLDIYANMYFFRLLDCLKEDYPAVLAAIGDDRFHNLITDYLLRYPSDNPSLRHLGRRLPDFVAGHALGSEWPWLGDLARLEWARVEMFDAADSPVLTREGLARLPAERAGEARFAFVPACVVLRLGHDVARLHGDLRETPGGDAGAAAAHAPAGQRAAVRRATRIRVWRREFAVHQRSIDEDEARSIELLGAGEPLGRVCQQLAAGRTVARATESVGRLLQTWLDDGVLASLELPA